MQGSALTPIGVRGNGYEDRVTLLRAQPSNLQIVGIALLLFSAVLLGVGIHHVVATGTCSSTGYSANYGPVPTCPAGTGWWFAFVFGGVIGSVIGALMAQSIGLVFAATFGGVGAGALSNLLDAGTQSGEKVFSAVFGGCFALVGVAAAISVIASAISSPRSTPKSSTTTQATVTTSAFGTPQASSALATGSPSSDPILSAYNASRGAAPGVVTATPLSLAPGLRTALHAAAADPVDELTRLADLHKKGALTDAEFASAKAKLLGRM
jgi:Short C-terminal domain